MYQVLINEVQRMYCINTGKQSLNQPKEDVVCVKLSAVTGLGFIMQGALRTLGN